MGMIKIERKNDFHTVLTKGKLQVDVIFYDSDEKEIGVWIGKINYNPTTYHSYNYKTKRLNLQLLGRRTRKEKS